MLACHRRLLLRIASVAFVVLLSPHVYADVAVNVPLDDPAYPLLEKLVRSNLTFANALTVKPITRLYAARLIADAIQQRRHELEATQRQDPFTDRILRHLARRFKRELRQIRFFYRPRRPGSLFIAPLADLTLEMVGVHDQFVLRDSSGLTDTLQGVFGLDEGFAPGNGFTLRARAASWATLWHVLATYVETDVRVRSDPLIDDGFEARLHKGYVKLSAMNLKLEFGLDNRGDMAGVLSGGNIIGGVLDGSRWEVRVEFAETRDGDELWYTHPIYHSGFAFEQFVLGHPIGGAAESLFGRAVYYLAPATWIAVDGRREQYGFEVQPEVTTQVRVGIEASHQFLVQHQRHLVLWGRIEYASLDRPAARRQHTLRLRLSIRWQMP